MTRKRTPDATPDLGSLSAVLRPDAGERRGMQLGLAVAVVLHGVFFAVTWPTFAGGERAVPQPPPKIYPMRQYEFTPPDPTQLQLPQAPQRIIPIPDSTPDDPEPEIRFAPPVVPVVIGEPPLPRIDPPPPPEKEVPDGPVLVGVDIRAPRILVKIEPRYTEPARAVRTQGAVILELLIDERGDVTDVTVLRGLPLGLTESAVEAVRQWRFEPSTLRGRPVAVRYNLTVHFRLE